MNSPGWSARWDVIVFGEVLVELLSSERLSVAESVRLSLSGDAFNAAVAAAATGADIALATRVGNDELGERIIQTSRSFGIDTTLVEGSDCPNGFYFLTPDLEGDGEFLYTRKGSAASTMGPMPAEIVRSGRVFLTSGITAALSDSTADAVARALSLRRDAAGTTIYDPNFRPRLAATGSARAHLRAAASSGAIITPSCPSDTEALLDTDDAATAARRLLDMGAAAVIVTCGPDGVFLAEGPRTETIPSFQVDGAVDATGAGDVLCGSVAGQLSRGVTLGESVRYGVCAAALSTCGLGGTGYVPTPDEVHPLVSRLRTSPGQETHR